MPTFQTGEPLPPSADRTIDDALAFGRQQWSAVWTAFARQYSQPQLIKLAESTLGTRALHSSQIHGFTSGKLRDPSPKLMMALGELNLAIAKANGEPITCRYTCPGTLSKLWQHKTWLKTAEGAPMGPSEVFEALTGLVDLNVNLDRVIPKQDETHVSQALGKLLRMELAKQGLDWLDEVMTLKDQAPCVEELLMNRPVKGSDITDQLEELAKIAEMSPDQLWAIAIAPHLG